MKNEDKMQVLSLSRRMHHGMHRIMRNALDIYQIGWRQMRILFTVNEEGRMDQNQLYKLFQIDRAVITHSLKGLVAEGYVLRERSASDMRKYELSLTDKGRSIVPKLHAAWQSCAQTMVQGLTDEELTMLFSLMERVDENIERELECGEQSN